MIRKEIGFMRRVDIAIPEQNDASIQRLNGLNSPCLTRHIYGYALLGLDYLSLVQIIWIRNVILLWDGYSCYA